MKLSWSEIRDGRDLQYPDLGDPARWDRWFEESWSHLDAAGLTEFDGSIAATRVRMRAVALWWVAQDFSAVCDSGDPAIYWDEVAEVFGVHPIQAVALASQVKGGAAAMEEAAEEQYEEVEEPCSVEEMAGVGTAMFVAAVRHVAAAYRGAVVSTLLTACEGPYGFLLELWVAFGQFDAERDEIRAEIAQELAEAAEKGLAEADVGAKLDSLRPVSPHLDADVEVEVERRLRSRVTARWNASGFDWGNEEFGTGVRAFEWISDGCPVNDMG